MLTALAAVCFASQGQIAIAPAYRVERFDDIYPQFPAGSDVYSDAINNAGVIAGRIGPSHLIQTPFRIARHGASETLSLPVLVEGTIRPLHINDQSSVTGGYIGPSPDGNNAVFHWSPDGTRTEVFTDSNTLILGSGDINIHDQIPVSVIDTDGGFAWKSKIWSPGNGFTDVPIPEQQRADLLAINDHGTLAGYIQIESALVPHLRHQDGTFEQLSIETSHVDSPHSGHPVRITNSGYVVGDIQGVVQACTPLTTRSSGRAAAVWMPDGSLHTDPPSCGSNSASYRDVNELGVAYGFNGFSGLNWSPQTGHFGAEDLVINTPGWTIIALGGADDCGRFFASAQLNSGTTELVILVPLSPCGQADLTTQGAPEAGACFAVPDGIVSGADIQYYVNTWVAQNLIVADLTTQGAGPGDPEFGVPDGLVSGADINYYVNLWIAGCP